LIFCDGKAGLEAQTLSQQTCVGNQLQLNWQESVNHPGWTFRWTPFGAFGSRRPTGISAEIPPGEWIAGVF